MAEGRFVFVFHEDLIANYSSMWHDDHQLATWLRLFALADKLWPSPAVLPRNVKPSVVKALAAVGLIELRPNHEYTVRGHDALRKKKAEQARNAANARHGNAQSSADSSAPSPPPAMPHGRAPSDSASASSSSGELGSGEEGDCLVAYHTLTGRFPVGNVKRWLLELGTDYGEDEVGKALAEEMIADSSVQTLLSRTENRLALEQHEAEKRRQAALKAQEEEERRKIASMPPEQRAENLGRLAEMMAAAGIGDPKPKRTAA